MVDLKNTIVLHHCQACEHKFIGKPKIDDHGRAVTQGLRKSCPNCKYVLINDYYQNPIKKAEISHEESPQNSFSWLGVLVNWLENSRI